MTWLCLTLYICGMFLTIRLIEEMDIGDGSVEFTIAATLVVIFWTVVVICVAIGNSIASLVKLVKSGEV